MTYLERRRWSGVPFLTPYVLSFLAFIVFPVGVAMLLAFMQFDLTDPKGIRFIGTQNFKEALSTSPPYFWEALRATLTYVFLMVPSVIVIALAMALGLNAMQRGRNAVRALLFLPGMFNVAVTGILWRWFYDSQFGLINYFLKEMGAKPISFLGEKSLAMPSIVVMSLWWASGGTCVIVLAALQGIPRSFFEAAMLDGAGSRALFSKVILPLLKPVLLFVVVTNTIGAFQVFGQPYLMTSGGPERVTRGLVQFIYETAFNDYRLGFGAAISWLLVVVVVLFAIVQYRFLRRDPS
jgi:multiple sugar transport system permease protein